MTRRLLLGTSCLVLALAAPGAVWHAEAAEAVVTLTPDDYVEINNLYAKYTRACDMGGNGDGSDYAAVFTPDGSFGARKGPAELKKMIKDFHVRLVRDNWASRHTYTTINLTPAEGGVKGSVYALIFNVTAKPPFVDHSGVYEDFLVKTKDGWRFKSRVFKNSEKFAPGQP